MITRPKKSLGQNWLRSEAARAAIIEAAELGTTSPSGLRSTTTNVVEIGPGEGFLTEALLATGATVTAIEKDDRLIGLLSTKFSAPLTTGQLKLIHGDALDQPPPSAPYKIVANIPYYLTGEILRHFLTHSHQPTQMVLMLQKEVADRIIARDGKESLLSISVKAYGEPIYVKTVPRGAFSPVPNVDSAILNIKNISRARLKREEESRFWEILHLGFAHKRKLVLKNLGCSTAIAELCTISPKARAENLTLKQWLCLTKQPNLQ